ncbi:putative type 1 pili usher protein CsuD [Pseudomonas aeruginosa]|nr:putative type 1 pili usher protein CsuD [Pseudomonas aeruginosa]
MPRPCQRRSRHHRSLLIGLALLSPVHAADYLAGLPPPQPAPSGGSNVLYYLELVINGRDSGQVVPVNAADGHYLLDAAALREAGVRLPGNPAGQVAVDALPEVRADYDSASQQLHLQVPPDWLPEQRFDDPGLVARAPARSSLGALFNYDLYYSDPADGATPWLSALLEQRLFDGFGVISNTGVYTRYFGDADNLDSRYLRYDTYWLYNDERNMHSYQLGDYVNGALNWTTPVRMGGLSLRPQLRRTSGPGHLSAAALRRPGRRTQHRRPVHQRLQGQQRRPATRSLRHQQRAVHQRSRRSHGGDHRRPGSTSGDQPAVLRIQHPAGARPERFRPVRRASARRLRPAQLLLCRQCRQRHLSLRRQRPPDPLHPRRGRQRPAPARHRRRHRRGHLRHPQPGGQRQRRPGRQRPAIPARLLLLFATARPQPATHRAQRRLWRPRHPGRRVPVEPAHRPGYRQPDLRRAGHHRYRLLRHPRPRRQPHAPGQPLLQPPDRQPQQLLPGAEQGSRRRRLQRADATGDSLRHQRPAEHRRHPRQRPTLQRAG